MKLIPFQPGEYSADVEIAENGQLVYARDVERGEIITFPSHMMKHLRKKPPHLPIK